MKEISRSPERAADRLQRYIDRMIEVGEDPNINHIEMYKSMDAEKLELEQNPEWQRDNMEYDLRTTLWILEKVRNSRDYAQNLYAALCNNDFQKRDVMPILKNKTWGCSWRYAGGIIADMRQEGDYMNWYCSGIRDGGNGPTGGYVSESVVTAEIEADLLKLGWNVIDSNYSGETDV